MTPGVVAWSCMVSCIHLIIHHVGWSPCRPGFELTAYSHTKGFCFLFDYSFLECLKFEFAPIAKEHWGIVLPATASNHLHQRYSFALGHLVLLLPSYATQLQLLRGRWEVKYEIAEIFFLYLWPPVNLNAKSSDVYDHDLTGFNNLFKHMILVVRS